MLFDAHDLDLDPVTLACELDLDNLVTYLPYKNEVNRSKRYCLGLYSVYILGQLSSLTETYCRRFVISAE